MVILFHFDTPQQDKLFLFSHTFAQTIVNMKLDEENPKYVGLAQENGFGNSVCVALPGNRVGLNLQRKACSKYDLTAAQCF
jgi:hypothetical protein